MAQSSFTPALSVKEELVSDSDDEPEIVDVKPVLQIIPVKSTRKRSASAFTLPDKEHIFTSYNLIVNSGQHMTVTNAVKITAGKFKVSESSVYNIIREFKENQTLRPPKVPKRRKKLLELVDDQKKNMIRKAVHEFYFRNDLPVLDKVLEVVNHVMPNIFKRTTLYKLLKKLNFRFLRFGTWSALVDRYDIIFARVRYLRDVKAIREERKKLYYLGEAWVYTPPIKEDVGNKYMLAAHIGDENGLVKDALWLYKSSSAEVEVSRFENWFKETLPKLEPGSFIVMNGEPPCHRRFMESAPDLSSSKEEIKGWLRGKGVAFKEDMLKLELIGLVKKNRDKRYYLDEVAKERNIKILRLPMYHAELNPMEDFWARVKFYVNGYVTNCDVSVFQPPKGASPIEVLRLKMKTCLTRNDIVIRAVNSLEGYWKEMVRQTAQGREPRMWDLDRKMEEALQPHFSSLDSTDTDLTDVDSGDHAV